MRIVCFNSYFTRLFIYHNLLLSHLLSKWYRFQVVYIRFRVLSLKLAIKMREEELKLRKIYFLLKNSGIGRHSFQGFILEISNQNELHICTKLHICTIETPIFTEISISS